VVFWVVALCTAVAEYLTNHYTTQCNNHKTTNSIFTTMKTSNLMQRSWVSRWIRRLKNNLKRIHCLLYLNMCISRNKRT